MKKATRFTSVLLAFALFASISVGCSGKTTQPAETNSNSETQSPASAEPTETIVNQPVTLTIKDYHAPVAGSENFADTAVGKAIKKELNITIKALSQTAADEAGNNQSLITDIASGNLPDIMITWEKGQLLETVRKAAKEGVLADLTDSIGKYGPVIDESIKSDKLPISIREDMKSEGLSGGTYILPSNYAITSPWLSGWGLYIRGDIAKAAGITTPDTTIKNPDDLFKVLDKIKQGNYKDVNGKTVYPLGMIQSWTMRVLGEPFDFGGDTGAPGLENGKIKGWIQTDYPMKQISFMQKLIKGGYLDPESLTQSYEIGKEKMATGRYAVTPIFALFAQPSGTDYMQSLTKGNPEMGYQPLASLNHSTGNDTVVLNIGGGRSLIIAVSKKANKDAAIKLINFLSSKEGKALANLGVKDGQWFLNDNGLAQLKPDAYTEYQKDIKAYNLKYGTGFLTALSTVTATDDAKYNIFGGDGTNYTFANDPNSYLNTMKFIDSVMPKRQIINKVNIDYLMNQYPDKDKVKPVFDKLSDTLIQCYLASSEEKAKNILTGYLDTLVKNGYNDYLAYLQAEYDKNPDKYSTYSNEQY